MVIGLLAGAALMLGLVALLAAGTAWNHAKAAHDAANVQAHVINALADITHDLAGNVVNPRLQKEIRQLQARLIGLQAVKK